MTESHDQNDVVMGIVGDATTSFAEAGHATIVEGIILPGWFYEPLRDRLRNGGLDVRTVVLRPSLETCLRRAGGRPEDPLAEPAVFERLWNGFTDLGDLASVVIDNGDEAPDATADAIFDTWSR